MSDPTRPERAWFEGHGYERCPICASWAKLDPSSPGNEHECLKCGWRFIPTVDPTRPDPIKPVIPEVWPPNEWLWSRDRPDPTS